MKINRRTAMEQCLLVATGITLSTNSLADELDALAVNIEFNEICDSLVIIEFSYAKNSGNALGVIATMDGKSYILTNQHILLGAERMSFITAGGEKLAPRSVELSSNRDLARLLLADNSNALPVVQSKAQMNTPIALINNDSEPENRILQGSIIGIGGTKFEISAAFGAEKNGGPVLNKEGQIVGIASYSQESGYHAMKKGTRFDEASRHFCFRVDSKGWNKVNWKKYNRTFGITYRKHKVLGDRILDILKDRDRRISSKEAREIASSCRIHSRQIQLLSEQKGMTDYLANELEGYTEIFEFSEEFFNEYADAH
ncbi:serine protease [Pontiellaceae bacterium B1224]|nr:serine protease [Pontiellaceae bacterium B1224]